MLVPHSLAQVVLLFAAAALAAGARAQGGACTDDTKRPSFELSDANRMTPEQFIARIVGRSFTYTRIQSDRPLDMRFTRVYRDDGSFSSICEARPRTGREIRDWRPCTRVTATGGTRDVGIWQFSGARGVICEQRTGAADPRPVCYSFHEQGGRIAVKLVSGPPLCLPGDIVMK
ncbi:MAG TPA: hypothetical protein VIF14_10005 [Alphaproteobacteria bacterium]|jgi:hypothetical protein